jgi:hypothetical protein
MLRISLLSAFILLSNLIWSQNIRYELNTGWICKNVRQVEVAGETISSPEYALSSWMPATVPGTILTTLLDNKLIPDPFFGMNNELIPDIYFTGPGEYTYWFVKDFNEKINTDQEQVWLQLRGVNYSCDVYLNGAKLNDDRHYGMFLRQEYNITSILSENGQNRLAIIVYPPDHVGNPNGGQGGDGSIARNLTHQYAAGWDWIQPIRDRNTGIWDKVTIEKTGCLKIRNPQLISRVPGKRFPIATQAPAYISGSVELENTIDKLVNGFIIWTIGDKRIEQKITLNPRSIIRIQLPELTINNPKLWWPNGYGEQSLYESMLHVADKKGTVSDTESQEIGIREIQTLWNDRTQSMEVRVNGQRIFVKGGNWIVSDALLRLNSDRYDSEIRFHRDMNLNMIRVWGGALLERPEFYRACDRFGLLVFQDFWITADCNGKWVDPMKKDDQWTRRKYPDDHQLFLNSVSDQVKMIRNHPSLALWCGGNEITPPKDILITLEDSLLPSLDGTRRFIPYSNSAEMSYNTLGGNGDGPYTIQDKTTFWTLRSYPFNSEIGSVGTGDFESLERFIPIGNMSMPDYRNNVIDSVWQYHKDIGYESYIDAYGKPTDIKDFAEKAQLVNYNQYRALAEGFSAHMWDWYSGYMIWKTQNPWTSLRGQMYDYYLDPNACLYGYQCGAEVVHVMCNPADGMLMVVNNGYRTQRDLMLEARLVSFEGEMIPVTDLMVEIGPSMVQAYYSIKDSIEKFTWAQGGFLSLILRSDGGEIVSDNLYWYPDSTGYYSGLQHMPETHIDIKVKKVNNGLIEVWIENPSDSPLAFFNRISLIDTKTNKRALPVFYSENYVSVLPGTSERVYLDISKLRSQGSYQVAVRGWNYKEQLFKIIEN